MVFRGTSTRLGALTAGFKDLVKLRALVRPESALPPERALVRPESDLPPGAGFGATGVRFAAGAGFGATGVGFAAAPGFGATGVGFATGAGFGAKLELTLHLNCNLQRMVVAIMLRFCCLASPLLTAGRRRCHCHRCTRSRCCASSESLAGPMRRSLITEDVEPRSSECLVPCYPGMSLSS
jgi:hypothetical protein